MYIPASFRQHDMAAMVEFMRANSFATLVSVLDGAPFASHIPLVLRADGERLTLVGHLAKANPHARALAHGESLAIFAGPHAYVSPTLYEQRESVPTWNYIAVHAYGPVEVLPAGERAAAEALMATMIGAYEASYQAQWESLSEKYRAGMLAGVVGFELRVTRLEGKEKLSQNRGHADRAGVAAALLAQDDPAARATGAAMAARLADETA